jgi:hypothetical protein
MITWPVEIDDIARGLVEDRPAPGQSLLAHSWEPHVAVIDGVGRNPQDEILASTVGAPQNNLKTAAGSIEVICSFSFLSPPFLSDFTLCPLTGQASCQLKIEARP